MDSKEFLKKFCKSYDYRNFQFILISQNIKSEKKYKEAYQLDALMPSTITLASIIHNGDTKTFKAKYSAQLLSEKCDGLITLMMKLLIKDGKNIVLMCTPEEMEYGYMKMLKKYIESVYKVKVFKFKEFDKLARTDEDVESVSSSKSEKILKKKLKTLNKNVVLGESQNRKIVKDKLGEMKRSELKAYAEDRGLRLAEDEGKKDIISRILKYIFG